MSRESVTHLRDLTPDPRNARRHTPRNVGTIVDALHEVGAARSIVIDENGVILAGNATVEAAAEAGIERVQVVDADGETIIAVRRTGLTPVQKQRLALFDNRAAELAEWEPSVLASFLTEDAASLAGLFGDDEIDRLLASVRPPAGDDPGAQIDRAEELHAKWQTERGQLWTAGRHRLACGDCTIAGDVARLLDGVTPDVVLTDPPYCSGGFQEAGRRAGSVGTTALIRRKVANDTLSTRGYVALLKAAISVADPAVLYVFTDWRMWVNLFDVVESSGYGVRNMIVWDKGSPGMGMGWRSQHELILFGSKAAHKFDGHMAVGNVLSCKRTGNVNHTTEKPIEILQAVLGVTGFAHTVYDPFMGSASTLVAAEMEGRIAFGLEMEPVYLAVALERLSGMGLTPRMVS